MKMSYHNPVLLQESVDALAIKEDGVYVDVTFGGGGHSKEILKRLGPDGKLFAFDQDSDALKNAIDEQDEDNIKDIMHVLKNSAALYGALTLAALASQLHDYPPVTIDENIHAAQIVQHNLEKTHAAYQVIANNIT